MNNLKKYYQNKKVLVTGHTGFKGSWLTLFLSSLGANVYGLSKDIPTNPSHYKLLKKHLVQDIRVDLTNYTKTNKMINKIKPNIIFHLAAQSLVLKSYSNPLDTFQANTIITINICEVLRKLKFKVNIIFITSDKVYKNIEQKKGYIETDAIGGTDPYSASKGCAELAIESYIQSFFLNKRSNIKIAVARAGNVIGGGDWSENRIVPDCIQKWKNKKTVYLRSPNSTRPWQHVLEPIYGYLLLSKKLNDLKNINGQKFNFGPNENSNYSVVELVKLMSNFWKDSKFKALNSKNKYYESNLLKLSSKKSKKILNWETTLNFKETVSYTIKWYLFYYNNKKNIKNFGIEQINDFLKKIK